MKERNSKLEMTLEKDKYTPHKIWALLAHGSDTRHRDHHTERPRNENTILQIHHHHPRRPQELHSDLIRHGFPCDIVNIRCGRHHCFDFHKNLLQPRPLHQSATFYFGHYSHCLLLVDVGNCIHCADEASHCPNPKRG
ncbi:Uncharacterized protein Rs2_45600 [Raphanus sativus]|nr:Uncharacterized protein Rs2_45600 [Raphanus sativus]